MSYIEHLFDKTEEAAKNNRAEIDRYNKELAYAKANAGREGYVSKPLTQYLDFKNETNANVNITGNVDFITDKNISNSDLFKQEYVNSLSKSKIQPKTPTILTFDVPLPTKHTPVSYTHLTLPTTPYV